MLLVFCIVLFVWVTASHWQMQQAMRWWFKREAIDLAAYSDQIQNGLIQDLFAVRLSLQLPLPEQAEDKIQQQQRWIAEADKLHHHLIHLSHALNQPYLTENLPLALRSLLKSWELSHPQISLQLDLPNQWHLESAERSRILLSILETLLKLAIPASLTHATLEIALLDRSPQAELSLKITYPDPASRRIITRIRELKYLCRCFRCLAPGTCSHQYQSAVAVWRFVWKP